VYKKFCTKFRASLLCHSRLFFHSYWTGLPGRLMVLWVIFAMILALPHVLFYSSLSKNESCSDLRPILLSGFEFLLSPWVVRNTVAKFGFVGIVSLFSAWEEAYAPHSEGKIAHFSGYLSPLFEFFNSIR